MARDISDLTDNFSDYRTVLASQGIWSAAAAEPGFPLGSASETLCPSSFPVMFKSKETCWMPGAKGGEQNRNNVCLRELQLNKEYW